MAVCMYTMYMGICMSVLRLSVSLLRVLLVGLAGRVAVSAVSQGSTSL